MQITDIKRRLAMSACLGTQQESLVNELLSGPVPVVNTGFRPDQPWLRVGLTRLNYASFRNLKKRLVRNGFVVEVKREPPNRNRVEYTIVMHFPEGDKP